MKAGACSSLVLFSPCPEASESLQNPHNGVSTGPEGLAVLQRPSAPDRVHKAGSAAEAATLHENPPHVPHLACQTCQGLRAVSTRRGFTPSVTHRRGPGLHGSANGGQPTTGPRMAEPGRLGRVQSRGAVFGACVGEKLLSGNTLTVSVLPEGSTSCREGSFSVPVGCRAQSCVSAHTSPGCLSFPLSQRCIVLGFV